MRRSAAHALGETGSQLATEPLIKELLNDESDIRSEDFNSLTFPTLVDVLSKMGDRRIVKPTLQRLGQFRSQAMRLQLLNSVCRAMGAGDQFYRLLSYDDVQLTGHISRLLKRASTTLTTSSILDSEIRQNLRQYFRQLISILTTDRDADAIPVVYDPIIR